MKIKDLRVPALKIIQVHDIGPIRPDLLTEDEDNLTGDGHFDSRLSSFPGAGHIGKFGGDRKEELTLDHLNRLKKIRRRRKAENMRRLDLIAAIYTLGAEEEG